MNDLHDKVAGALALSALGDVLGLPCEAAGLRGEVSPLVDWELSVVDGFREPAANCWNIWAPPEVTAGMRGVVSDDTAVRLVLIEPWLADAHRRGVTPTESDWRIWLRERAPESVAWREATAAESAWQWLGFYDTAAGNGGGCDDTPCFYRPGVPVCFGHFLFLELGLIDAPVASVLDQGAGVAVSGLLGRAASEAVRARSVDPGFAAWWPSDASFGERHRSLSPAEFLAVVRDEIYHGPDAPTHDLKPFDPTLQLRQISACVGYAGDEPLLAIRLLASGAGDTDTLAATLGMILGARLGHAALRGGPAGEALRLVEASTETLFGRSTGDRVRAVLGPADSIRSSG